MMISSPSELIGKYVVIEWNAENGPQAAAGILEQFQWSVEDQCYWAVLDWGYGVSDAANDFRVYQSTPE